MFDEHTLDTWKRAEAGGSPPGRKELERMLEPSARRSGRALSATLLAYLLVPLGTAVLAATNVAHFADNPSMVALELSLCVVAVAFALHSLSLYLRLRREDPAQRPLVEGLRRRLELFDRSFGAWMLTASVSPWLLSLAINTRIDGSDGTWHVNHPVEFVLVSATMVAVTYVALRVSLRAAIFEMRAVLQDLVAEALEVTPLVADVRRRTRGWMTLLTVLLVLSVLAGLWMWWRAGATGRS